LLHGDADTLVGELDEVHRRLASDERDLLRLIATADARNVWRETGARDMESWLSIRYGITAWKARRWLHAAHALESLPALTDALASGRLSIDKVVELARFASFEDEDGLIAWASRVSVSAVRRRADLAVRRAIEEVRDADRQRFVTWWYSEDGARFGIEGELPAADGAVVAKAIDRLAERIPTTPGEEGEVFATARKADALVTLCSSNIGADSDADRATVVVHMREGASGAGPSGADIEGGPVIAQETAERLRCESRTQTVVEDASGEPLALGRMSRFPSAAMLRQLRYRDVGCTFPGCGSVRFVKAHHIVWWRHGGRTDLANLVLVCTFHHKLLHEHGWTVARRDGAVRWFRPDGTNFVPGPAPPERPIKIPEAFRTRLRLPSHW
jgi:Domain of unknown function (DUF222)/HNH endonuclease